MPVCIIGMHRSGTSMIAQLLKHCGLELGPEDQLMVPSEANLGGHFENLGFVKINSKILSHFKGAWDHPPDFNKGWEYESFLDGVVEEARSHLKNFSNDSIWGWKDPRTTLLIPFWKRLIHDLKFVICIRGPLEVAESLLRRDGMTIDQGAFLWGRYVRDAIRNTSGCPRIFVFYEDFFENPDLEINRLINFCSLHEFEDKSVLKDVVSRELKHHSSDTLRLLDENKVSIDDKLFYIILRSILREGFFPSLPNRNQNDFISEAVDKFLTLMDEFHDQKKVVQLEEEINKKNKVISQLRENDLDRSRLLEMDRVTLKDSQIHEIQSLVEQKEEVIEQIQEVVLNQQKELNRVHSSISWKFLTAYGTALNKIFPHGSKRRKSYDNLYKQSERKLSALSSKLSKISLVSPFKRIIIYSKHFWNVIRVEGWKSCLKTMRKKNDRSSRPLLRELVHYAEESVLFQKWISKNEPGKAELKQQSKIATGFSYRPLISIIVPIYNPEQHHLIECIRSVMRQTYSQWELCLADGGSESKYVKDILNKFASRDSRIKVTFLPENKGIAGNSNEALKLVKGDYVGFLDHDDMLAPFALYEVVRFLNENPVDFIYSDEDIVSAYGYWRYRPHFKPDWSPDTMLSYNFVCHFSVLRKKIMDEIGGLREGYDGAQDYDLVLRIAQKTEKIAHIPKILYHWRAAKTSVASNLQVKMYALSNAKKAIKNYLENKGLEADVLDGKFLGPSRVKYKVKSNEKVTIIIPTKDKIELLRNCVFSILTKTDFKDFEVLIVDNGSQEITADEYYRRIINEGKVRVIHYLRPFNFSAINNFAVSQSSSKYVVFLNNDTEVISSEWLSAMYEFAQRKDIGAVGAKLYYSDGSIQHAGLVLGIGGSAGHSHKRSPGSSHGYMGRLNVIQNVSAVTAACMMVRKEVFDEIGGFDEKMPIAFNDVDFCLKIREKGYLIVYTPYAELYHYESKTRGYEDTPEKKARLTVELQYLKKKWKHVLEKGDPYYNPNLTLVREDFNLKL